MSTQKKTVCSQEEGLGANLWTLLPRLLASGTARHGVSGVQGPPVWSTLSQPPQSTSQVANKGTQIQILIPSDLYRNQMQEDCDSCVLVK